MLIVANAFSTNMLNGKTHTICFRALSKEEARALAQEIITIDRLKSIVGHESTAQLFSAQLDLDVKMNREDYKITKGDILLVGALGRRLEEGKILKAEELQSYPVQWWMIYEA